MIELLPVELVNEPIQKFNSEVSKKRLEVRSAMQRLGLVCRAIDSATKQTHGRMYKFLNYGEYISKTSATIRFCNNAIKAINKIDSKNPELDFSEKKDFSKDLGGLMIPADSRFIGIIGTTHIFGSTKPSVMKEINKHASNGSRLCSPRMFEININEISLIPKYQEVSA